MIYYLKKKTSNRAIQFSYSCSGSYVEVFCFIDDINLIETNCSSRGSYLYETNEAITINNPILVLYFDAAYDIFDTNNISNFNNIRGTIQFENKDIFEGWLDTGDLMCFEGFMISEVSLKIYFMTTKWYAQDNSKKTLSTYNGYSALEANSNEDIVRENIFFICNDTINITIIYKDGYVYKLYPNDLFVREIDNFTIQKIGFACDRFWFNKFIKDNDFSGIQLDINLIELEFFKRFDLHIIPTIKTPESIKILKLYDNDINWLMDNDYDYESYKKARSYTYITDKLRKRLEKKGYYIQISSKVVDEIRLKYTKYILLSKNNKIYITFNENIEFLDYSIGL